MPIPNMAECFPEALGIDLSGSCGRKDLPQPSWDKRNKVK